MKENTHFGGIPTDMDIRKLRDKYPETEMQEGFLIKYEDVENLLDIEKKTARFKTVTTRWRKKLLNDFGIVVGCEFGLGFKVLNDAEKLDLSGDKLRFAARSMRRSVIVSSKINRRKLNDEDKNRLDLYSDRTAKSLAILQIKKTAELPTMEPNRKELMS